MKYTDAELHRLLEWLRRKQKERRDYRDNKNRLMAL